MQTETTQNGIRAWFDAALDIPQADRRPWLEKHCVDRTLLARVLELLAAHDSPDEPISRPVGEWFLALDDNAELIGDEPDQLVGKHIAGFKLLRHLGSGGMSSVYLGERSESDFHQLVAIKVLKNNIYSATEQRMFRRERQLLAELEHPNIARFIDGGLTDGGLPYLIMEYVDGQPINVYCDRRNLSHEARVRLFLSICRATDHAHRYSIVHRDIKPANILVSSDGTVKLLDFGIAKLIKPEESSTLTAKIYLTPEYAAPEQFKKGGDSTAIDVYSLGVLLHELLVGVRPNRVAPVKPSHVVSQQATTDKISNLKTRSLKRYLEGDLDNIIAHATQEDPTMRYRNAGELADDLKRFLNGQPVEAHPPSAWYRTRKFVQRHRGAVGLTVVLVLAVLASLGLATMQSFEAKRQANKAQIESQRAQAEANRANQVLSFVLDLFGASREVMPEAERLSPEQLVAEAERKLQDAKSMDPIPRAQMWMALGEISHSLSQFASATRQFEQAEILMQSNASEVAQGVFQRARVLRAQTTQDMGDNELAAKLLRRQFEIANLQDAMVQFQAYSTLLETMIAQKADDALSLANTASSKGMKAFPEKSEEWLTASLLPARVMAAQGMNAEAEPLLRQGAQDWQTWELPKNTELVDILNTVGVVQFNLGQSESALKSMDQAIALTRDIHHGPSNSLVRLLESRAAMSHARGHSEQAIANIESAIEAANSIFSSNSAVHLSLRATAAGIFAKHAEPASAIGRYEDVLALCEARSTDTPDGDCGRAHANFASFLVRLNRLPEADAQLQQALLLQGKNFGESSTQVAHVLNVFGNLKAKQKLDQEALSLFDRALRIYFDKKIGDKRLDQLQLSRAKSLVNLGQWSMAETAVKAAIEGLNVHVEKDLASRANAHALLALIAKAQDRSDEATQAARQARTLDPDFLKQFSKSKQDTLRSLL